MSIELTNRVRMLEVEMKELRERISDLCEIVNNTPQPIDDLGQPKRGPGRPRKDATLHLPGNV
ncbi:hypothetical protein [Sphingomonas sp.]|jgi:hypothetical protein|uniref:hypothetical protein n=1 Tax=Sphingomonas sp. TaxID=28214 RepID=UPI003562EEB2